MTELRSEKFEWFDPSPIEPFNPGVEECIMSIPFPEDGPTDAPPVDVCSRSGAYDRGGWGRGGWYGPKNAFFGAISVDNLGKCVQNKRMIVSKRKK